MSRRIQPPQFDPLQTEASHARTEAFGTYLFVAVRRPAALARAVRLALQVVDDVDATCSRFREDSDLSRVNRAPGTWVDVDPLLVACVEVACEAAALTGGIVNPLLGRALVRLGYDRDFRQLRPIPDPIAGDSIPTAAPILAGRSAEPVAPETEAWRHIGRDPAGGLRLPAGTALDLGSIGKAWTADLIAAAIETELGEAALVSLGGDVRISLPDGRPWLIGVSERPHGPAEELVGLQTGGLATSSTRVRRWSQWGIARHHVVDPRTGEPAAEVWRTVTATGPSCVAANTASTAAVVLGHDASAWLAARGVAARLVPSHGAAVTTDGWPGYAAADPRSTRVSAAHGSPREAS